MIKGIFFDVGGTLYSYKGINPTLQLLFKDLAARLDLEHSAEDVARHFQLATKDADKHNVGKPFYLFHDYFADIFTNFLQRIEKPHLAHHFGWFEEYQLVNVMGSMTLRPDCHDMLTRLKDKGFYLSAVSNADENMLTPLVERGELHRWLTHWTSSEAARSCKPDRQFFEVALAKSGLAAEQVLFVGDSLEQDIAGAHAMGMTTALITEPGQPAPMHVGRETPEPDFHIANLSELLPIVDRLAAGVTVS